MYGIIFSTAFNCTELKATGCAVSHVSLKVNTAPVQQSLASHVTKIEFLPRFSWSMVVRHGCIVTSVFMASNTVWCSLVHSGKTLWVAFMVNRVRMHVCSVRMHVCPARLGKKAEMYWMRPRKDLISLADFGVGQFRIRSTFALFASIPLTKIQWPRKSIWRR